MSWGLYPLFFASYGLGVASIGVIKAVYPVVWGCVGASIHLVAALTLASGVVVAVVMRDRRAAVPAGSLVWAPASVAATWTARGACGSGVPR